MALLWGVRLRKIDIMRACEICGTCNKARIVTYHPTRCWDCLDCEVPVFQKLLASVEEDQRHGGLFGRLPDLQDDQEQRSCSKGHSLFVTSGR